jgi:phosphate/phosphite/phosphonate ABC transporter binding protein
MSCVSNLFRFCRYILSLNLFLAPIVAISSASISPSYAQISLTFGTYAADKPTETVRKFKPFLDYLSTELSNSLGEPVTIRIKIASEYDQGISDLTEGRVDFSRFGPASYVTAKKQNPAIRIIAMESKNGKKTFQGIIAVHSGSDMQGVKDLKGRSFAFGAPLSTIGRYLAQAQLLDAGVTGNDLKRFAYLGRHDRVGRAVGNRDFDAGALKESTFRKLQAKNIPIKALLEFDNVTKPWIASSEIPVRIFDALTTAMLNAADPDVLKTVSKSGFLPGDDSDYDAIRSAMLRSTDFN